MGLRLAALITAVTAGVTALIYVNFSARVMPRLGRASTADGIATMQRFNRTALRPPFMLCFFGAAVSSVVLLVLAAIGTGDRSALFPVLAGGAYLVSFGLTVVVNVPLNERLAALAMDDPAAAAVWQDYRRRWTSANTVRASASATATVAAVLVALG